MHLDIFITIVFVLEKNWNHHTTELCVFTSCALRSSLFYFAFHKDGKGKLAFSFLSIHILTEAVI